MKQATRRRNFLAAFGASALVIGCVFAVVAAAEEAASQPAAQTQPADDQPSATVMSLQIVRPVSPELTRAANNTNSRRFNGGGDRQTGIDLQFVVHVPGRSIVSANDDSLQVQTFIDDKYNDLGHGKREHPGFYGQPSQSTVTEDGHNAVFSVSSDHAPDPEASRILVRGTVTLRISSGEAIAKRQKLALRVGKVIDVGPLPLTLRSISDAGVGPNPKGVQLGFQCDGPIDAIQSLRFFAADGKEIESHNFNRFPGNEANHQPSQLNYFLPENLDEIEVEVKFIQKIENVAIPIELQADIGAISVGKEGAAASDPLKAPRSDASPRGSGSHRGAAAEVVWPARRPAPVDFAIANSKAPTTRPATALPWPPPPDRIAFPPPRPAITWPATRPAWVIPAARVAPAPSTAPTLPGSKVELISVAVNQLPAGVDPAHWQTRPELLFQGGGGTWLRLVLTVPNQFTLLNVERTGVSIDRYADDTGAELSTVRSESPQQNWSPFGPPSMLGADGHHSVLGVALQDPPKRGATRIFVRGRVNTKVGVTEIIADKKDVPIAIGTTISAGPVELRITGLSSQSTNIGGNQPPVFPVQVSFLCSRTDLIRNIEILDGDGKPISSGLQRLFGMVTNGSVDEPDSYTMTCTVPRDFPKATVRITYFDHLETAVIPFDAMVPIGL